MTTTTNRGTLVLPCDICRKPVTGKAGYICVDKNDVRVRRQLVKEWKNSTTRLPPCLTYYSARHPLPWWRAEPLIGCLSREAPAILKA